jgi:hypothetical protein
MTNNLKLPDFCQVHNHEKFISLRGLVKYGQLHETQPYTTATPTEATA